MKTVEAIDKLPREEPSAVWYFIVIAELTNNERAMLTTMWFLLGQRWTR